MAADQRIPVYTNLADLYSSLGTSLDHAARWANLAAEFERRFGQKPAYIARAPGRVNLIGEHIDYALFGVLPAAIERDILIACARSLPAAAGLHSGPGGVVAENLHPKYTRQVFVPGPKPEPAPADDASGAGDAQVYAEGWHLDINTRELRWESYVKAGYYGVLNHYFALEKGEWPVPVDLLVTGSVPAGSGLSSSAAMVVASTLAFLAVNGKLDEGPAGEATASKSLTKGELVKMAMENETRVGVNSGGMDQAASILSPPSSALSISFFPTLHAAPVALPSTAVFVCANSLVVSDKAVTAKARYNLRVVETLVGARVLARALGVPVGARERVTLREVVGRWGGEVPGAPLERAALAGLLERMGGELGALRPAAWAEGGEEGVLMEEMVTMSGLEPRVFAEVYLRSEVEAERFQLYKRAKHVCEEALRVLRFEEVCVDAEGAAAAGGERVLRELGALMDASQASCRDLYECSCPELDELTRIAREAGAYGSRLTGAGWGGCTVSLVAADAVEGFIGKVRDAYGPYKGLEGEALEEVVFATRPSVGACVYKF